MYSFRISYLSFLFLLAISVQVHADLLDCNSGMAQEKFSINLGRIEGKPLQLISCTDQADWVLGRAYLEWTNEKGLKMIKDLSQIGGCGSNSLHAKRVGNDVLISFHTCTSRYYHPNPKWVFLVASWREEKKLFDVRLYGLQKKLRPGY